MNLYEKAVDYVLCGMRTEREVARWLTRKGVDSETAAGIIDRLKSANLINDELYAQMFAEQKSGKLGVGQIRMKLMTRGISGNLIDQSLESVQDESQEQLARTVAEKFLRNKSRDANTMQKLYRHLAGKGFSFDLCKEVTNEMREKI